MKIYTLTLNPAYDIHCSVESLCRGRENFVRIDNKCAGGKGLNVSKALTAAGVSNIAYVVLGNENSSEFIKEMSDKGICHRIIPIFGRVRENITVHEPGGVETRISFGGAPVPRETFLELKRELLERLAPGDFLTLTGSLPEGVSVSDGIELLEAARLCGVKTVLDSRSFSLSDIAAAKPYLIKPNEEEIAAYSGSVPKDLKEAASFAERLRHMGVENVIVSLGDKGAALASPEGKYTVGAPEIEAISTIGAGDSGIGGFIFASKRGLPLSDCLRFAVAFGSAACLEEGTEAPDFDNVMTLFDMTEAHPC